MAKKWLQPEIEDVTEPFCGVRRRVVKRLSEYSPLVAIEWCYKKNCGWGPEDFSHGSNVRAWWVCPSCSREYKATIKERTRAGHATGCPYCNSKKVCSDNSLSSLYPNIAKQWHPSKNGKATPKDVTSCSQQKRWWQCKNRHTWRAAISSRTTGGRGCPKCAGQQASKGYNLEVLFPNVASQWHPELNGEVSPDTVTPGSSKLFWWLCKEGPDHVWQAPPKSRTTKSSGCPCCAHKKVSVTNSLASLYPKIAREWHKTRNGKLQSTDVLSKSGKVVWWQCEFGHSWREQIVTRTHRLGRCPKCRRNP